MTGKTKKKIDRRYEKAENREYNTRYTIVPKLSSTYLDDKEPGIWATDRFIDQLSTRYVDYYTSPERIEQRNGLTAYEFCMLYRMGWDRFKQLCNRWPKLERARQVVKLVIAMRRENGYEYGDLTGKTMHMMRYYSDMWEEHLQDERAFRLQLADKTQKDSKTIIHVTKECFNEHHEQCNHD